MGASVREAEHRIDIRLFLNEYPRWELGTPHWSVILHEMFLHTAERGQKEVEHMVCQGHQGSASEPNPEVDVSTIHLVGSQTSKEKIWSLYLEVYKLQRLLGSPPGDPELMEEVVSFFEDCQGQKQREAPEMAARSQSTDIWPQRSRTPRRGRRESSVERSLAKTKGGPSEGTGHGGSLRRGNRVADPPPHQESVRGMGMFKE